jgi:hypothetical protein
MSRNSAGIPDPLIPEWVYPVGILIVIFAGVGFFIWARYAGPCSWWSGSSITEMPLRCLKEMQP